MDVLLPMITLRGRPPRSRSYDRDVVCRNSVVPFFNAPYIAVPGSKICQIVQIGYTSKLGCLSRVVHLGRWVSSNNHKVHRAHTCLHTPYHSSSHQVCCQVHTTPWTCLNCLRSLTPELSARDNVYSRPDQRLSSSRHRAHDRIACPSTAP